jgi:hypothetical protein
MNIQIIIALIGLGGTLLGVIIGAAITFSLSYLDSKRRVKELKFETKKAVYGKLLGKLTLFNELRGENEYKELSALISEVKLHAEPALTEEIEKLLKEAIHTRKVDTDKVIEEMRHELKI